MKRIIAHFHLIHQHAFALLIIIPAFALLWYPPAPTTAAKSSPNLPEFTIVALPDTQYYSAYHPQIFPAQTEWIVAHAKQEKIKFVASLGDIVDIATDPNQWAVANAAYSKLDGVVPYGVAPGNHDMLADQTTPIYSKLFPVSRFSSDPTWGGAYYDPKQWPVKFNNDNSFRLIEAGDSKLIVINTEFCPSNKILSWVNYLLDTYADRTAILTTHAFLAADNVRYNHLECQMYSAVGYNGGEEMWAQIGHHPNLRLILSGHNNVNPVGAAQKTDYVGGKPVYQLMSDYQQFADGGGGYLRLMRFVPAEHKIKVSTYSPYYNDYRTDPANQFELTY